MRPIGQLLADLRRVKARVWADGDRLRYQAPKGALAPELLDELRARKAEVLEFCRAARPEPAGEALAPTARDGDLPVSLAQQRLWVLDRLEGPSATYNIALALRFRGALDVGALRRSLEALMERHEPLRTAFRAEGETIRQVIAPAVPLPCTEADLSPLPAEQRLPEARRLAREEALRPFDLRRAPLVRFVLWRLDGEDHVLFTTLHHIIADGRSIEVLAEELEVCYGAYREGRRADLPELRIQFADFARHQRQWLKDDVLQGQLEYWKRQLAGLPPLLELPADRPRPPLSSAAGATLRRGLDAGLAAGLKRVARDTRTTPYLALLAGVAVLVARYTGREDIAIGCPVTHRKWPELERLVGFFVDSLVLRIDVSGNPSFRELLTRTRAVAADGFAHQDVPFDRVVEAVGGARNAGYAPLVQLTIAMLDGRKSRVRLPGLDIEPFDFGNAITRYDISLEIYESDAAFDIFWIYNTGLFDAQTISRMARHLDNLFAGAADDPDRCVTDLPLLDPDERHRLLEVWGRGDPGFAPDLFIHRLFEAHAERTPDAVAVAMAGRRWSYGELNVRANRLAHRLIELGVGPEVLVGVCIERSFELVASLLAVLKAGGAYVPLDPDYPRGRLAFMVQDSRAAVLLASADVAGRLPDSGVPVIYPDALDDAGAGRDANPARALSPEHPAYVIYTSGSSGRPKGVVIPHRAIGNHMCWMGERFPLGDKDAVLQKTPCSFDASVWEFYAPLLAGARLVMARSGGHADPGYLVRAIREERVTILQMVPTLLQGLVDHPDFEGCASLRRIFVGGEALPADLARKAAACGAEVCNLYGPTEAAIDATYFLFDGARRSSAVPIGRPIANTLAYVLDGHMRPVPVGVAGELYLGGAGLALGYLRHPDLSAERFVPNPFSQQPARLYKTGDRVRWLADGNLEFVGRIDEQVKIRGLRIEPGEIEAVLGRHAGVARAVVVAHAVAAKGPILAAYVAGEPAPGAVELRAYLRKHLPDHMVPTAFVFLPSLPVMPNGKVDRRALPAPDARREAAPQGPVLPRNPTERSVADIWARFLGLEQVGVHDNFFDLGGHSLIAAQITGRVREEFGAELPTRLLFEGGTVAKMAEALEEARRAARDEAAAALRARIEHMDPEQVRELLRQKRARQRTIRHDPPEAADPR